MSPKRWRHAAAWWRIRATSGVLLVACGLAARGSAADDGLPVTVVTIKGEAIVGKFLRATSTEVALEIGDRTLTLPLRDVGYISFAGRPAAKEATSYAPRETPSSQLRLEGAVHEARGRLNDALRKYEEAAKLDPSDPATVKALDRVRKRLETEEAGRKAAPFKRLAVALKEAKRYAEASACYEEAVRLDPGDLKFRESLGPVRH